MLNLHAFCFALKGQSTDAYILRKILNFCPLSKSNNHHHCPSPLAGCKPRTSDFRLPLFLYFLLSSFWLSCYRFMTITKFLLHLAFPCLLFPYNKRDKYAMVHKTSLWKILNQSTVAFTCNYCALVTEPLYYCLRHYY